MKKEYLGTPEQAKLNAIKYWLNEIHEKGLKEVSIIGPEERSSLTEIIFNDDVDFFSFYFIHDVTKVKVQLKIDGINHDDYDDYSRPTAIWDKHLRSYVPILGVLIEQFSNSEFKFKIEFYKQ